MHACRSNSRVKRLQQSATERIGRPLLTPPAAAFRTYVIVSVFVSIFSLASVVLTTTRASAASDNFVYLTVRQTGLHENADFFSPVKGTLRYGDPLVVVSRKDHWFQVRSAKGLVGFIHESALTSDKDAVRLAGATAGTTVTGGEVSLAGKGFSAEVEQQLERKNSALNFTAVDELERSNVQPTTVQSFAKKGKLTRRPTA